MSTCGRAKMQVGGSIVGCGWGLLLARGCRLLGWPEGGQIRLCFRGGERVYLWLFLGLSFGNLSWSLPIQSQKPVSSELSRYASYIV
jgi:hypothetical protein